MNRRVVVKIGGSLFDWPELAPRLKCYLESRRDDHMILIAGGGEAANWIRRLDSIHTLGQEMSHDLALRTLDLTTHILSTIVDGLEVIASLDDCARAWERGHTPIANSRLILDHDEHISSAPLPHTWNVTSDSIAAWIAVLAAAHELVLLKSAPLCEPISREEAARRGLVDAEFPRVSARLECVSYRHFRDPDARTITLSKPASHS